MAAITTNGDHDASEQPAALRVESFLELVEARRRRTERVRVVAVAVGALIAAVALLTSTGAGMPGAGRLVASAETLLGRLGVGAR